MKFSWSRALIIARREYLTTVRRKAFIFTMIGMPLYFGFVMTMAIKPQMSDRRETLRKFTTLGVVDSSGLYRNASGQIETEIQVDPLKDPKQVERYKTQVRFFDDPVVAQQALRAGKVSQVLVIPADYLASGKLRRYTLSGGMFSSSTGERPIERWLVRNLLEGEADSLRIERVTRPTRSMDLYTLNKQDAFELKDDRREVFEFMMPFMFAMLLGLCIVTGGQYLLQGVSEEKESRILESLLCTVTAEDLLAGKLLGLGGAGLTLVAVWMIAGSTIAAPSAALLHFSFPPALLALSVVYFMLGYLFYASLMTGIGAVTNNMREAQQFAFMFTFANFVPFIMLTTIMNHPDSGPALGLSMFPPTAPVTMMLRMAIPSSNVPPWQIAVSITLLAAAAWLAVRAAARVFRIGLLLYGKTPNLPEILRWAREGR
jgi:ABC-2 type transport system permease protein